MNEEYDVVVCGTGFKECVLSGLLSVSGKKVLHVDRNGYYGGESASLNLTQLFEKYGNGKEAPKELGANRDWNVDLIPKFIMSNGKLVKMLLKTGVHRYLEFKVVDGSYVNVGGKVAKVPASDEEALRSSLMGLFEKRRAKKFFVWVDEFDETKPESYKGFTLQTNMIEIYKHFGLEPSTIDFVGHSLALELNDQYLVKPFPATVKAIKLYMDSMLRYGKSPYLYPMYGLGELPQGFARLSAIYGGTYMLNKPVQQVLYENGVAVGIQCEDGVAKAKMLVGDPSYFTDKVKKIGEVIRCICILSHPLPSTDNSESSQIIIPQTQVNRKNDIYIACVSAAHSVCSKGKYVAIVSTIIETANPLEELAPGFALLGAIDHKFPIVSPIYEPTSDGSKDKVFISTSYDATSHFETECLDIMNIWKRITGETLDLTVVPQPDDDQQ